MKKTIQAARWYALLLVVLLVGFAGCAANQTTPEGQIKIGSDTVTAASNLGRALLLRGKITAAEARNYSDLLHTASKTLDDAHASLVKCRANTHSTQATSPDPCKVSVQADIQLATTVMTQVESTLKTKETSP